MYSTTKPIRHSLLCFDLSTVTNKKLLEFIRIAWELMDNGKLHVQ